MLGAESTEEEAFCYRFGEFRLCPRTRELSKGGERLCIEYRVFDLLAYLVRNCDRAVGKAELEEVVWGGKPLSETVLSHTVMKARQAINDCAGEQKLIRTIRAFGYRFVGPVTTEPVGAAAGAIPREAANDAAASDSLTARWPWLIPVMCRIAMVIAAVAILAGVVDYFRQPPALVQPLPRLTLYLPPVHARSTENASMAMRLTMLLDRRLSGVSWLQVDAVSSLPPQQTRSGSELVLVTDLAQSGSNFKLAFTLGRGESRILEGAESGENPFAAAEKVVQRISGFTRDLAQGSAK